ncbi:DUF5119 domain-containing protein [Bacteroides sp.]
MNVVNKLTSKRVDKGLCCTSLLWTFPLVTLFTCLLVTFTSCNRRDITYYMESEITVRADWGLSHLPEEERGYGAMACFFPQTTGTDKKPLLMGDRTFEEVRLPEGVYHAVIFNRSTTGFGNISFRGDTYDTFEACARQVETRTDPITRVTTRVIVSTPEELAADVTEGYEITEAMLGNYGTLEYLNSRNTRQAGGGGSNTRAEETDLERYVVRFTPLKLTQRVRVCAVVPGVNNVRSAVGTLDGVSEGIFFSTGQPTPGTVTQQFVMGDIEYNEGSPFDGTLSGEFNVFGFERGVPHKLTLKILLVDGKTVVDQVFEVLAKDVEEEDGTLTLYIEITSGRLPDVKPEGDPDSGFDANVDEWGDPIESEIKT